MVPLYCHLKGGNGDSGFILLFSCLSFGYFVNLSPCLAPWVRVKKKSQGNFGKSRGDLHGVMADIYPSTNIAKMTNYPVHYRQLFVEWCGLQAGCSASHIATVSSLQNKMIERSRESILGLLSSWRTL